MSTTTSYAQWLYEAKQVDLLINLVRWMWTDVHFCRWCQAYWLTVYLSPFMTTTLKLDGLRIRELWCSGSVAHLAGCTRSGLSFTTPQSV